MLGGNSACGFHKLNFDELPGRHEICESFSHERKLLVVWYRGKSTIQLTSAGLTQAHLN